MVDMGDLREGIWFGEYQRILETVTLITGLPGLELYGLGTNFNCYGTVLPTVKKWRGFSGAGRPAGSRQRYSCPAAFCGKLHQLSPAG